MSEPGRIAQSGARGSRSTSERTKSLNMIKAQRMRIEDAFRDAYYNAEQGDYRNLGPELERLNRRINAVNNIANRYESNIQSQPEYQSISNELRRTFREGGRSAEEARETAKRINELREKRNNLRYSRGVYMRNNRRS